MNKVTITNIDCMINKTVERIDIDHKNQTLTFSFSDNSSIQFYHSQDCCEDVGIEDICGDVEDLIGSPILVAESSTKDTDDECGMWAFYIFSTIKGTVNIRWFGSTDSCYALSVSYYYKDADGNEIRG